MHLRQRLAQGLELEIIRSAGDLSVLAEEWNDLAIRCPGYFLSQTFQWAETAWETIARLRGRELNCVTLRSEGRLVAVWPLVVSRDRGLRTIRPLGFEGSEYCAPLIEPGEEAEGRIAFLWQAAARSADLAVLPHVRADSPLAGMLKAGRHWCVTSSVAAPYLARADYLDWAAYYKTIGSKLRYEIRRGGRRLAEQGEAVLERASPADCAALIDWMLDHKKRWLARSNLTNDWIARPDYRDFLVKLATREDATGGAMLFALKLSGVPIAAALVGVDRSRVEGYVIAYDLEWNFSSPGQIFTKRLLQWAFERGLDFDFRIGDDPYKRRWANRSCDTVSWHIATNRRGIPTVAGLRAALIISRIRQRLGLGRYLPPKWRSRLKVPATRRTA